LTTTTQRDRLEIMRVRRGKCHSCGLVPLGIFETTSPPSKIL
jgi:hypothetical protein